MFDIYLSLKHVRRKPQPSGSYTIKSAFTCQLSGFCYCIQDTRPVDIDAVSGRYKRDSSRVVPKCCFECVLWEGTGFHFVPSCFLFGLGISRLSSVALPGTRFARTSNEKKAWADEEWEALEETGLRKRVRVVSRLRL